MRIGIDVGGTNTDAVLMDGVKVAGSVKRSTRENVTDGIKDALESLRKSTDFNPSAIEGVMIGTTHFINALIEAKRLAPTAAIRLCLPATAALPPLTAWPSGLTRAIAGRSYMVSGGHEFDGREIAALDVDQIKQAASDMGDAGIRSVAITSVFSPVNHEFEEKAAEILAEELPGIAVSLSNRIGRVGLLERETRRLSTQPCASLQNRLSTDSWQFLTNWESTHRCFSRRMTEH